MKNPPRATPKPKNASKPSRGRPRDPETDAAILRAAERLLSERGFAAMSLEAVAEAANVTKPTIYRRYRSKADLATAAIADIQRRETPSLVGDTRTDLVAALRHFQKGLLRPNGMRTLATVLVEEHERPELIASFRERVVTPRRQMLREILAAAQARQELAPGTDVEAVVNLLVGSFYARYLTGEGIPRDWPERVVGVVWVGVGR